MPQRHTFIKTRVWCIRLMKAEFNHFNCFIEVEFLEEISNHPHLSPDHFQMTKSKTKLSPTNRFDLIIKLCNVHNYSRVTTEPKISPDSCYTQVFMGKIESGPNSYHELSIYRRINQVWTLSDVFKKMSCPHRAQNVKIPGPSTNIHNTVSNL